MDFKSIIGHEEIKNSLIKSMQDNTTSHAYLFQGEEGLGKKKLAYAFAKALLCLSQEERPCNTCLACKRFESQSNPDFLHIEADKGMIKIDSIKLLQSEMKTAPINSKNKIIIIEEAHLMNKESGNKLLKTLEEPPSFVHIILTSSNPFKLLPTILSRVQIIDFFPVSRDKIQTLLVEEYGKSEVQAKFITQFTKGAVGRSIDFSKDDLLFERRDTVLKMLDSIISGDKTKAFYYMDFFEENKDQVDEILDIMIYYFRDILLYNKIGESELLVNNDKIELLSQHSFMEFNKISDIIINIMETKDNIKKNINYKLAIEAMLLNI